MKNSIKIILLLFSSSLCFSQVKNPNDDGRKIRVPVIFHLIYSNKPHTDRKDGGNTSENLSDVLLLNELKDLHDDFLMSNNEISEIKSSLQSLVGNPNVEFFIADTLLQSGGSKGIIRTYDENNSKNLENKSKIINPKKYLNIYIGNGSNSTNTKPWESADSDAIFLNFSLVGLHNHVATHETGHWLGLYHIWGKIGSCSWFKNLFIKHDDGIDDTPKQCLCTATYSNDCPPSAKVRSILEGINFMDYSNCRKMFTVGQAIEIRENIIINRQQLLKN